MLSKLKRIPSLSCGLQLVLMFFFFTFSNQTFAQNKATSLNAKKGIAILIKGTSFQFKSVEEKENTFVFTTINKTKVEIAKSNLTQIDIQNGNFAEKYSFTASAVTAAFAIALIYNTRPFRDSVHPFLYSTTYIITPTIVAGIIGAIIGATNQKYKTVYNASSLGRNIPKFQLNTTMPNLIPSLTLSYSF
ncbi:MAG: hypothetical protein AB8H03_09575 [Saprospiraceae bacterium]